MAEKKFYGLNWKKYKKGCKEIVDIISESSEQNPKTFMAKVGIETDEEYQADLSKMNIWD